MSAREPELPDAVAERLVRERSSLEGSQVPLDGGFGLSKLAVDRECWATICSITSGTSKTMPITSQLRSDLESRKISSREIVGAALRSIDQLDPDVGAFLSRVDESECLRAADEIDNLRARGLAPSPFAGIPIAIKDNIAVSGMPLTCGSRILENYSPPYSATAVERLVRAGIIVIGKTNMDEFGFGSSTENSAFHVTRNPYDLKCVPGGTSGGSAAAVASGMVPWALGTDTGGSVRQPASLCGVVGMRPTYGAVSRYGLVAYASSMDQIGPIANSVDDVAALLEIISGADQRDSTCIPGTPISEAFVPKNVSLGIPKEYMEGLQDKAIVKAMEIAESAARSLDWTVKVISLPMTRFAISIYYLLASVEAASNLARYDGVKYGFRSSGHASYLDMLMATRSEGFGPEAKRRILLGTFASSAGYNEDFYGSAMKARTMFRDDYIRALADVTFILAPISPTTAWPLGEKTSNPIDMYLSDVFSVAAPLAGIPSIALPVTKSELGLPAGVQLCGLHTKDGQLLAVARQLESKLRLT